jgi:RNA polymerase sigma-70 factor, ECF subfamily
METPAMPIGPITQRLTRLRAGDHEALDELLPLIYDELKILARSHLAREATGHTFGPTVLVHETYMRLAERERLAPEDRRHFFAISAQIMRRVLIDHARARRRLKRGAGAEAVPWDDLRDFVTDEAADELIALEDALEQLSAINPRAAQVVERRFFAGLSLEETAESLGTSLKTIQRDWLLARAWLRKEMDAADG